MELLNLCFLVFACPQQDITDRLIQDLGDDSFEVREAAMESLSKLGKRALPAIRRACASKDLEVASRAAVLLRSLDFHISKALLVDTVNGFEDYHERATNRFKADHPLMVYVQPKNSSLSHEDGQWGFDLKYDWRLIDEAGADRTPASWNEAGAEVREDRPRRRGPWTDYFQTFSLRLTATNPGRYWLRITVTDLNDPTTATRTKDISIVIE
jgi:hypothetical protein